MTDSDDSLTELRVAVKPSAIDGNDAVEEVTGSTGTVLTFTSREAAEVVVARLTDLGDRPLSIQRAAPQDTSGVEARFTAAEKTEITIDPVEYEVVGRRRRIQGLEADFELRVHSDDVAAEAHEEGGRIYEPCLFAVQAYYAPISSPEISTYTLTTDADDALAVACWLSHATDPMGLGQAIEQVLQAQAGEDPDHYGIDYPTDEERVKDIYVENPNRCFYSGKTTRSHLLRLPFRYAPLLKDHPENAEALPAVPSRVGGFEVAVSHTEWSDRGLSEGALEEPMEHIDTGVYQLLRDIAEQAEGFPVEATGFRQK